MSKQIADILKRAKKLIVQHGWTQGQYGNKDRGYCVLGAIEAAVDETKVKYKDEKYKDALIAFFRVVPRASLISLWNDAKSRRKKQVLAAFDKAIKAELKVRRREE